MMAGRWAVCWVLLLGVSLAFYLPGIAPVDYSEGMLLEVYSDHLQSTKTQFPYDYYSLPFCPPREKKKEKHLNLGEILLGERDELTALEIFMLADEKCKVECTQPLSARQVKAFRDRIKDEYLLHLNVDNMPLVMKREDNEGQQFVIRGVPLGYIADYEKKSFEVVLFNHFEFKILYHQPSFSASDIHIRDNSTQQYYRIVGFEGMPYSKDYDGSEDQKCPKNNDKPLVLTTDVAGQSVTFTYTVTFEESSIQWATRWDSILYAIPDELPKIQWFSILNSIAITVFLTALVAVVLFRTVYLDFARYNNIDDAAEAQEETGWKQVHADVFRPPLATGVLCTCCGYGAQLSVVAVATLFFSLFGFFSPAARGGLLSGLLLFWVLSSFIAGYFTARMYVGLHGQQTRLVFMAAALCFSVVMFSVFFLINLVEWFVGSSGAVNFFTLLLLLTLWFGISVPLSLLGSFLGGRRGPYKMPTPTSAAHRAIPEGADSNSTLFVLTGGLLPFACVFIEFSFILNSLWQDDIFYMFGFLLIVFIILSITCAEVSVVITYFFLSNEDYNWWWRAFFTPASSGVYVFVYSIVFLTTQPDLKGMHLASSLLYLGYMTIISVSFALLTGFIGFEASFLFVTKMFSSVKID